MPSACRAVAAANGLSSVAGLQRQEPTNWIFENQTCDLGP